MTNGVFPGGSQNYERLLAPTEIIENLGHSPAYAQLLTDKMDRYSSVMTCDETTLLPQALPEEIYFTDLPSVKGFKCSFDEVRDTAGTSWSFTALMDINGTPWTMSATPNGTTLRGSHYDERQKTYDFPPETALRFMGSLAYSFTVSGQGIPLEGVISRLDDTPRAIDGIMNAIASNYGRYRSELFAKLPYNRYRAVVAKLLETETSDNNGVTVELRMARQFADGSINEVTSVQREASRKTPRSKELMDAIAGPSIIPSRIESRFVSRRPISTAPEDISTYDDFAVSELTGDASDPIETFDPRHDLLEYLLANSAIMTVLRPHLKPYSYLG